MRMNALYVTMSVPLLLMIVGFIQVHGLTTFGKKSEISHGNDAQCEGRPARRCENNFDCRPISGSSCVKDPYNKSPDMFCLCNDKSQPCNGKCPADGKAQVKSCTSDADCQAIWGTSCVNDPNNLNSDGMFCLCSDNSPPRNGKCTADKEAQVKSCTSDADCQAICGTSCVNDPNYLNSNGMFCLCSDNSPPRNGKCTAHKEEVVAPSSGRRRKKEATELNMDLLKSDIQILLSTLNIQNSEKHVTIIENGVADANFVLCHILKHVFQDPNKALCLVMLHNTLGHYQNVGKRLNYNLSDQIKNNNACIVEPLNSIADDIGEENSNYLTSKSEDITMKLFLTIEEKLKNLLSTKSGLIYLLIDDISHLLDLGVEIKHLLCLLNTMINFDERVNLVIGTHVSGSTDQNLCNALTYISDVIVEVSPLKTGRSFHLSGILDLKRKDMPTEKFNFKATDRGIRLFRPGESLQYLKHY